MLLKDKIAVVYGAGAVGGAVAKAFAREGSKVFVSDRTLAKAQGVAAEIIKVGGQAEAAKIDVLNENDVEEYVQAIFEKSGKIDVSFNAMGIPQEGIQGTLLTELSLDNYTKPIHAYTVSHFLTARAAARRMVQTHSGVVLMHTPEPAIQGAPHVGGMGPAWAGIEALSRDLSAELARQGVRSIVIRSTGLPQTKTIDLVFELHAKAMGMTYDQFKGLMESMSHTGRSTTLEEVANAAVFAASDLNSGMTGAVINITGGKVT